MSVVRVKRKVSNKAPIIESDNSESENESKSKKSKLDDWRETEKVTKKKSTSRKKVKETPVKSKKPKTQAAATTNPDLPDGSCVSRFPNQCISKVSKNLKCWQIHELLAEREQLNSDTAKNIIQLFENENTIPFLCRYRRDLIGENVTPEKLRDIKNTFTELLNLQKRAETIIEKEKDLNDDVKQAFRSAKTLEELDFLYAPYKPANKGSLADRATALGLDCYAEQVLFGHLPQVNLERLVNISKEGLDTVDKISDGITHILSHIMSKNTEVLEELRKVQEQHRIVLKCSQSTTSSKSENTNKKKIQDDLKYEHYFNFENAIRYLKPHQVLAINRGEKAKILSVKIIVPDRMKTNMKYFIRNIFLSNGNHYSLRSMFFEKSFEECYTKKLLPYITRQIRSDLNEIAKKASIEVFAKNLKQLLLISPLKGEKILGIDPGFANGCKLALISETADLLDTGVIYPHTKHGNNLIESGKKLLKMLTKHNCRIIALGNGTACRETEFFITRLFEENILDAKTIKYSIVSEQGASIYSCSDIAKSEFPKLDINIISAVSIARRLNDPLSEYVKIEPKHIGVGMYQHDINEKSLTESLNEVVMECVSFVGVDINTASISILKHISGLSESRAAKIIEHRQKNGPFKKREDLLKVKTIGDKTFKQCAGFIRIERKSIGCDIENPLDCTWVHPESYDVAIKILKKLKLNLKNIGQVEFITVIKNCLSQNYVDKFSVEYKVPKERIDIILNALQRELLQDYRQDFDKKPLFKSGISKMTDLKKGARASGAVTNITHFGAFVDIGVENDGLIHTSNMAGMTLNIGDRVDTIVLDVELKRKRIQLKLENIAV